MTGGRGGGGGVTALALDKSNLVAIWLQNSSNLVTRPCPLGPCTCHPEEGHGLHTLKESTLQKDCALNFVLT